MAKQAAAKTASTKKTSAKKTATKTAAKKTAARKSAMPAAQELIHCYRLIFQVEAGGSRKAESFVAGTLDEAKAAALADLASGDGAYHALYYGEHILLQLWEGSRKIETIDLHPYIEYRVEGVAEPLRFHGPGDESLLDMDGEDAEQHIEAMLDEQLDIAVEIDWAKIRLPTLQGRAVREGETVTLERGSQWQYGHHEHWDSQIKD